LPEESTFRVFEGKGIFAHKMLIQAEGIGCLATDSDALWQYDRSPVQRQPQTLTFIPWFSWANRGEGEMRIWVDEAYLAACCPHPAPLPRERENQAIKCLAALRLRGPEAVS
jgi:hypothetical protein